MAFDWDAIGVIVMDRAGCNMHIADEELPERVKMLIVSYEPLHRFHLAWKKAERIRFTCGLSRAVRKVFLMTVEERLNLITWFRQCPGLEQLERFSPFWTCVKRQRYSSVTAACWSLSQPIGRWTCLLDALLLYSTEGSSGMSDTVCATLREGKREMSDYCEKVIGKDSGTTTVAERSRVVGVTAADRTAVRTEGPVSAIKSAAEFARSHSTRSG